ncbi:vitamin K epoxide reductase family protein [Nocardioides sp. CBS4Y-1]|uniref:Vitamin K epoxide reductase family protein n=1 Tax=Nocardioides acrostichi TaxID=2784339 RepID=A0A930UXK6_9ACTN|nr:vitamin K epoxide reductase family protein [Nocardioides acrostichi]
MRWTTFVLAVAGLGIAAYLTYEHVTGSTSLACPATGRIDCAKVTSSSYSSVLGIPVELLGLGFFVALVALTSPPAWRSRHRAVDALRWAAVVAGLVAVFYLVWAELYRIHAICLWCTGVHVIVVLEFVAVLFAYALHDPEAR